MSFSFKLVLAVLQWAVKVLNAEIENINKRQDAIMAEQEKLHAEYGQLDTHASTAQSILASLGKHV